MANLPSLPDFPIKGAGVDVGSGTPAGGPAGLVSVSSRSTPDTGSLDPSRTITPSTEAVPVRAGCGAGTCANSRISAARREFIFPHAFIRHQGSVVNRLLTDITNRSDTIIQLVPMLLMEASLTKFEPMCPKGQIAVRRHSRYQNEGSFRCRSTCAFCDSILLWTGCIAI